MCFGDPTITRSREPKPVHALNDLVLMTWSHLFPEWSWSLLSSSCFFFKTHACVCRVLGIRYKTDLNHSNNFKRLIIPFYWMLKSDLLDRSALTSHNRKLRTKPFWRAPDQVVRTWSWSRGRQNTPTLIIIYYCQIITDVTCRLLWQLKTSNYRENILR